MNIYIYIYWIIFLNIIPKKISQKRIFLFIIFPMFISLATQTGIGTDYYSYVSIFKYGDNTIEKGFLLLNKFLMYFSSNERILFVGVSFIQTILLYIILIKYNKIKIYKNINLFMLTFILVTGEYIMMFNGIRSSIASLFFNLFLIYFFEKKILFSLIFIIFGGLFHKSIYLSFLIVILGKRFLKKIYSKKILIVLFILSIIINKFDLIYKLTTLIYNIDIDFPYKYYLISKHMKPYRIGFGIATNINMLISLILIKYYPKENNKLLVYYNLGYFSFAILNVFLGIPILSRIIEYFTLVQTIVVYNMIIKTLNKKNLYVAFLFLLYYLLQTIVLVERMLEFNKAVQ